MRRRAVTAETEGDLRTDAERWRALRNFLVVTLVSASTTFGQSFGLFVRPPLYCEDGLFFSHFYNGGGSIFWAYNGYVSLFPNVLAWLATLVPVTMVPYLFSGTALALGSLV